MIINILLLFNLGAIAQPMSRNQMEREIIEVNTPDTTRLRLMIFLVDSIPDPKIWEPLNDQAFELARKLSNETEGRSAFLAKCFLADAISNKGYAHKSRGNIKKTLDYYFEGLQIRESIGYQYGIASSYNNLSRIFDEQGDTSRAIIYLQKSLKIRQTLNDQHGIAQSHNNIGHHFLSIGNTKKALENLEESIRIFGKLGAKSGLSKAFRNLADVFFVEKQYVDARKALEKSKALFEELADNENLPTVILKIAEIDFLEQKYNIALSNIEKALAIAQKYGYLKSEASSYLLLSKIYEKEGNNKKSLDFHKKYVAIDQQINRQNIQNNALQYEYAYEDAKKEAAAISKQNIAKQQQFIYFATLTILIALIILFSYIAYTRAKTNKNLAEKNKEVEAALTRAEESERFKSQFLSNMSHEIRTPMNAILGMSALLKDTKLDEKQENYTNAIRNSSENLLLIINDVLDFSKLEQGKMALETTPFALANTLKDVYDTMRFKAEEKGLTLSLQIDNKLKPYLLGDGFRLYQVLINLVSNAIKFTEKGKVEILVELVKNDFDNHSQVIYFAVKDTGVGIPENKIKTIFDSFKQANESIARKYGGTGLGLSISQQLVALRKGKIEVESEVGLGSKFYFTLTYPLSNYDDFQRENLAQIIENPLQTHHFNILLVEDNEYNRIVAKESLQKVLSNAKIIEVENGLEALEKLKNEQIDIILMDIQMPELDGYETAKRIRSEFPEKIAQIPIIALTAYTNKEEEDEIKASGMNDYVHKPFKINNLLNVIVKYIQIEKNVDDEKDIDFSIFEKNLPSVDLAFLKDFTEENTAQMIYFINKFISTIPKGLDQLNLAISENNFEKIRKASHNIKPQIEFIGIKKAMELVTKIEDSAISESPIKLISQSNIELENAIVEAIKELRTIVPPEGR